MSTLEMITAWCGLIQSVALLICAVMSYFTGKKLLAAWREMTIALWDLRGLINTLKCTGCADTLAGGNESRGVVADDSKAGAA